MNFRVITAITLSALFIASGCSTLSKFGSSKRPECGSENHIIYYNYKEEDLRASTQPMIKRIAEQVAACEASGGKLRSVTIVGFPNRADTSAAGDETAVARGQAVLDALVAAGLPADKVKLASYRLEEDDLNQPMRRRAEIAVEMR